MFFLFSRTVTSSYLVHMSLDYYNEVTSPLFILTISFLCESIFFSLQWRAGEWGKQAMSQSSKISKASCYNRKSTQQQQLAELSNGTSLTHFSKIWTYQLNEEKGNVNPKYLTSLSHLWADTPDSLAKFDLHVDGINYHLNNVLFRNSGSSWSLSPISCVFQV